MSISQRPHGRVLKKKKLATATRARRDDSSSVPLPEQQSLYRQKADLEAQGHGGGGVLAGAVGGSSRIAASNFIQCRRRRRSRRC